MLVLECNSEHIKRSVGKERHQHLARISNSVKGVAEFNTIEAMYEAQHGKHNEDPSAQAELEDLWGALV